MDFASGMDNDEKIAVLQNRARGMEDWPIKIMSKAEIPNIFVTSVLRWMVGDFSEYEFIYVPKQLEDPESVAYIVGYGDNEILYVQEGRTRRWKRLGEETVQKVELNRNEITEVISSKDLLESRLIIHYGEGKKNNVLEMPYNTATHYLYTPFLNWLLGLDKNFDPAVIEKEFPRPAALLEQSQAMYNYSLDAYRLGEGFQHYNYKTENAFTDSNNVRKKEWLKIIMDRGDFEAYKCGYLIECKYRLD